MQGTQGAQKSWVQSLVETIPWNRKWQPTPGILPGKSHGQRSLVGYGLWDRRESDMTEKALMSVTGTL